MTEKRTDIDICIINPWLLEPATKRGGGIEEIDYQVALGLSKYLNIILVGPYYKNYSGSITLNERLSIEEIRFPAIKNYPPKSKLEFFLAFYILIYFYSFLLFIKLLLLKNSNIKIFIVHNGLPGLVAAVFGKLMNTKIIFSEGNTLPWVDPHINPKRKKNKSLIDSDLFIGKLISKLSDVIRVQSSLVRNSMIENGVNPKKINVIYAGVDTDYFKPIDSPHKIKVGFIGRLREEKGVEMLIEIIKIALKEIPNISFIIMGDGHFKDQFSNLKNVEHIGFIKRDKLPEWISKVNIFLFINKQLGLAEVEAMSSGKAIIVPDIGEMSLHITNLKNGIICKPHAISYINAIKLLCNDKLLLEQISKNSRNFAVRNYSWKIIIENWYKLFLAL